MKSKDLYRIAAANIKADREQIRDNVLSGGASQKKPVSKHLSVAVSLCSFLLLVGLSFVPYFLGAADLPSVISYSEDTTSGLGILVIDNSYTSDIDMMGYIPSDSIKIHAVNDGSKRTIKRGLIYNGRTLDQLYEELDAENRSVDNADYEKSKNSLNIIIFDGK